MSVIADRSCPACSSSHTFCLVDSDMFNALAAYEYVCPKTGDIARVAIVNNEAKVTEFGVTLGSVVVTEVR